MKAIVNTAPGKLEWLELPMPQPGRGQVRVRTSACGICATDLAMIEGWSRTGFPAVPGHEWSGVVDAVGPDVDPNMTGWPCVAQNVLSDGGEVGFEHPGGYGQFLLTEARNVRKLPAGFPADQAVLIEPLAVCVRMVKRLTHSKAFEPELHRIGRTVIMGDGPIGLLTTALLHKAAEDLTLVGERPPRLELARQLGAHITINYRELPQSDLAGAILNAAADRSGRRGFDTVIEASGSPAAMNSCLDLAAPGGRVMMVGDYACATADFPWNRMLHNELELIGSNASAGAWDEAVALACAGAVPLAKLISHPLPADQFAAGIEMMRARQPDLIKVVLQWA